MVVWWFRVCVYVMSCLFVCLFVVHCTDTQTIAQAHTQTHKHEHSCTVALTYTCQFSKGYADLSNCLHGHTDLPWAGPCWNNEMVHCSVPCHVRQNAWLNVHVVNAWLYMCLFTRMCVYLSVCSSVSLSLSHCLSVCACTGWHRRLSITHSTSFQLRWRHHSTKMVSEHWVHRNILRAMFVQGESLQLILSLQTVSWLDMYKWSCLKGDQCWAGWSVAGHQKPLLFEEYFLYC